MSISIHVTEEADEKVQQQILQALVASNQEKTGQNNLKQLAILIQDSNSSVVGGFWGRTAYGWLFTELLFVPRSLRGQGYGTRLMQRAEQEALARGCHSAWLDTFEFQAPAFYERLGYETFGQLENYPAPYARFFMQKRLRPL